jgi:hypothetical protein
MKKVWAQCRHKSATESVDFLFKRLLAFSGGNMPHDDIAAVVLKVLPWRPQVNSWVMRHAVYLHAARLRCEPAAKGFRWSNSRKE